MGAIDGWNEAIVRLRKRAGLKQGEAAVRAKLSPAQLSRYESGVASPTLKTLGKLLDIYDADLAEFGVEAKKHADVGCSLNPQLSNNFIVVVDSSGQGKTGSLAAHFIHSTYQQADAQAFFDEVVGWAEELKRQNCFDPDGAAYLKALEQVLGEDEERPSPEACAAFVASAMREAKARAGRVQSVKQAQRKVFFRRRKLCPECQEQHVGLNCSHDISVRPLRTRGEEKDTK